MWTAVLFSSTVLAGVHWAAAIATVGLGVIGTLSILFAGRTAPWVPSRRKGTAT